MPSTWRAGNGKWRRPSPVTLSMTVACLARRTASGVMLAGGSDAMLCFGGVKTPIKPKVWDENQFGTSVVQIRAAKWLCLPSTKQVIP